MCLFFRRDLRKAASNEFMSSIIYTESHANAFAIFSGVVNAVNQFVFQISRIPRTGPLSVFLY
jgi:hypothetical protein